MKIKRLSPLAIVPQYKTPGSAGMDLVSIELREILPGSTKGISIGWAFEIPNGFEGQVRTRSSYALQGLVVANSPGTIDSDYRGEVKVILRNCTQDSIRVRLGDRIAQLVITALHRATPEECDTLSVTGRGCGGFGSTGAR